MTPLIDVFEYIRKQKHFRRKPLMEKLGIEVFEIRTILETKRMPGWHIVPWCEYLELGITDYAPLQQYHHRSMIYLALRETFDMSSSETLNIVTNLLYFGNRMDLSRLLPPLLPMLLPLIEQNPYPIRNAIEDIDAGLHTE